MRNRYFIDRKSGQVYQEGSGVFSKVLSKITSKTAKEIAKKAITKATETAASKVGEKTGQLVEKRFMTDSKHRLKVIRL